MFNGENPMDETRENASESTENLELEQLLRKGEELRARVHEDFKSQFLVTDLTLKFRLR